MNPNDNTPAPVPTPRADAAIQRRNFGCGDIDWVSVKFARTLERELQSAQAALAEAQKDRERLDWLQEKSKFITSTIGAHRGYHELPSVAVDYWCGKSGVTAGLGMTPATLRAAIDAAMQEGRT